MNPIFSQLPIDSINLVLSFRIEQMWLTRTTGEFIEDVNMDRVKSLLRKNTKSAALCKEDIGQSHWKRTDHIIIVPIHLEHFVRVNFTKLYF